MVQRKRYLDTLIQLRDKKLIKVITGVRRCGKSTLLDMFKACLLEKGVAPERIIAINLDDIQNEPLKDYRKLYDHIKERLADGKMSYVFVDEIQQVPEFQKTVNSLFIKDNADLYITGSNARLLSGELATLLSGRYIEITMLPLSFREYAQFTAELPPQTKGEDKRETFNRYFRTGGFPYAATLTDEDIRHEYLRGIYNSVLLKDIVARKNIGNVENLERVIRFLFDNVGNIVSPKKIADSLTSHGHKTSPITVEGYIGALMDAFILYKAGRYDVKGKQYLKSLEKYYLVDIGLRNMLLGEKNRDIGYMLENIVYLELIRRGYQVWIGKAGVREVDFIARAGGETRYYQVAATVADPASFEREFASLEAIKDNYPKYVLTMDELPLGKDGINQMNIIDFLLEE
jgi:predicted AAA+ superfamily ATPase